MVRFPILLNSFWRNFRENDGVELEQPGGTRAKKQFWVQRIFMQFTDELLNYF